MVHLPGKLALGPGASTTGPYGTDPPVGTQFLACAVCMPRTAVHKHVSWGSYSPELQKMHLEKAKHSNNLQEMFQEISQIPAKKRNFLDTFLEMVFIESRNLPICCKRFYFTGLVFGVLVFGR